MVPGEEADLQKDTAIGNGVMAKQDTSNDNAHEGNGNEAIHPQQRKEMIIPKQKLQAQRKPRGKSLKGKAEHRREQEGNKTEYIKDSEKKDIMQLVAKYQEMPEEMGARRESRKHLAIPSADRQAGRSRGSRTHPTIHMRQLQNAFLNANGEDESHPKQARMQTSNTKGDLPQPTP